MRARILIEVVAGVIPGQEMLEYKKMFAIGEDIYWDKPEEVKKILDEANNYMRELMDPHKVNWVRLDWVYL